MKSEVHIRKIEKLLRTQHFLLKIEGVELPIFKCFEEEEPSVLGEIFPEITEIPRPNNFPIYLNNDPNRRAEFRREYMNSKLREIETDRQREFTFLLEEVTEIVYYRNKN